jgi:MoaA/NifB/PqqE/SkfB family radical SAM enzyme
MADQTSNCDLLVLVAENEPRLLREAFVAAELARLQKFATVIEELRGGATGSNEDSAVALDRDAIVARVVARAPRLVALGVARQLRQPLAVAEELQRRGIPVLLFGRSLAVEARRKAVPIEAAGGVAVSPLATVLMPVLRQGFASGTLIGVDCLDGAFRPRPPDRTFSEGLPSFAGADLRSLRRRGLPIRLSSGCPRRCTFCGEQPIEGPFRVRHAVEVVHEMAYHRQRNGVVRFAFCDLALNGDLVALESLCDQLLEKEVMAQWWGRAIVDACTPFKLFRKLRLAGCLGLELEVISGSDRVLGSVNAGFTADEASVVVARTRAAGIAVDVSLRVGLPSENEQDLGETAAWLMRNRTSVQRVVDLGPCELAEGSPLRRDSRALGLRLDGRGRDEGRDWHDGGQNTLEYRLKRARDLRVLCEDELRLEIGGRSVDASTDPATRAAIVARSLASADRADVRSGRLRREHHALAGALGGGPALAGPSDLEIDLTNNCNLHCAGCWIHSLLLGDDRLSGERRRATLAYDHLERLLRDARRMGTRRVQLSGAGEPMLHPRFDDIVALIKELGLELTIITNFTLVDEARARRLVDLGVDELTISLWAGSTETYLRTHPTARPELFGQIVSVARQLADYRRATGTDRPRLKVYDVISTLNCDEIREMIDAARVMGADTIEFTPIDVVPGRTDELALTPKDRERVLDQLLGVRRRGDYLQRSAEEEAQGRVPGTEEQEEYARFLQRERLPGDFAFSLEDIHRWVAHCRRGVYSPRIADEPRRNSAIVFGFPAAECHRCLASTDCEVDPVTLAVHAPLLSLHGLGSFWRRVERGDAEGRDVRIVDRVPCRIGYTYARVQATGHVIPCCKAASFPLGNILESSFEEIWRGPAYEEFRHKALALPKSDPYFTPMDCYRVCDNLGHNLTTHETIAKLSAEAAAVLRQGEQR